MSAAVGAVVLAGSRTAAEDAFARARGADPSIVDQRVSVAEYPGFEALARQLKASELRVV